MSKFLIRNDDVGVNTTLDEIQRLCNICDKHGYPLLHGIVLIGENGGALSSKMDNDQIRALSSRMFSENREVQEYLKNRDDWIGVHGLWHTHKPSEEEIKVAEHILRGLGLNAMYFIPPFNEGEYLEESLGLKVSKLSIKKGERLEDFLKEGTPSADVMYLHSWRFNGEYTFDSLDGCLARLGGLKLNLGCKNRKLPGFDNLDKIQGWYFQNGLNYPDNSVKGITISHALMFLTDQELGTFMKEMWRVFSTGGVVRITEDDTENPKSDMYKTGNVQSGPKCMTGPNMMRTALERVGFKVKDVSSVKTHFVDRSLLQAYRGSAPKRFFIEGIKT